MQPPVGEPLLDEGRRRSLLDPRVPRHSARAGESGIGLNRCFVFQSSRVSWAEAREPRVYRPILIAVLMRFLQQLTGITPILVYLQTIFDSTSVVLVRTQAASTARSP